MFNVESKTLLKTRLYANLDWILIFATTALALSSLGLAKLVWSIPKPLLLVVGGIFLITSGLYWWLGRKIFRPTSFSDIPIQLIIVLLAWVFLSGFFLGGVYRLDKAGWLWTQITGYNVTLPQDLSGQIFLPAESFVQNYPIFKLDPDDSARLILPKGVYEFEESVVIPDGTYLEIEPGAILRFGVGRSLISYGPIIARGTETDPIQFSAINPWLKWGVVGLVSTDRSVFDYVWFKDGRQALVNGVEFFGGLSLIETQAEITNSQFVNMYGKDSVYIKQGDVLVKNNLFRNAYKDCLDFDGGRGEISSNIFLNCSDESIDLSANLDIKVFDNQILGPNGGRISADNHLDEIISLNTLKYIDDE